MTEPRPDESPAPDTVPLDSGSWLVSFAFWLVLFTAAGVYAAVSLAPKLVAFGRLENYYVANQMRLVDLERRNDHLERICAALESDADFAAQLLRADFQAGHPDEERIAVDPRFHLDVAAEAPASANVEPAWYLPLVERLNDDEPLRHRILMATAVAVVLAFTILHDANGSFLRRCHDLTFGALGRFARSRYGRTGNG